METYHAKSESRKYSNLFSRRLSSKPVSGSTVSEMHALRNEDPNMVTASILHELPEIQEMHLSRVQRAIASQLTGFASVIQPKPITHNTSNGGSSSAGTRYSDEDYQAAERSKRIAQDQLLLQQLDKGVLPESFIKSNATARSITINLSRYGIGDVRGVCLGKCLSTLDRLESLGLSDNRLTANSIPTIMENLHPESLLDLDLSFNDLHDKAMKSVANHFRFNDNVLRYMDLSNSGLKCVDVKVLCNNLKVFPNGLEEMYLAGNKIAGEGAMGK